MDNPASNQPPASTTPTPQPSETAANVVTPPATPAQPGAEQTPSGLGTPTPTPSFEASSDKKPLKIIGLLLLAVVVIGGLAIGGYYLGLNKVLFPGTATPTPAPTVEPTPTATTDPTADWKTYTHTSYEFNIKYPSDWIAKSTAPGPGEIDLVGNSRGATFYPSEFKDSKKTHVRISLEGFDLNSESIFGVTDFDSYVAYAKKNQFFEVKKSTETTIDGSKAVVLEGEYTSSGSTTYHKNYLVQSPVDDLFLIILLDDANNEKYKDSLDQILSTFQFVEPTGTPSPKDQ
ncbi:hypothetical protein HYT59_02245 [Candidatus Woesebacteria bacterium]|nr:hypothetical protein [Candidatus Woesebacteria bacterium]